MIIGKDFNARAKEVLRLMYENTEGKEGVRIEVKALCMELNIDKPEAKNIFEYLEAKDCIKIETMGGPYLYGDVSLTKKGVVKSQK